MALYQPKKGDIKEICFDCKVSYDIAVKNLKSFWRKFVKESAWKH